MMDFLAFGASIDGIFLDKQHAALVPSMFIVGFEGEKRRKDIHDPMFDVMFKSNPCKYF